MDAVVPVRARGVGRGVRHGVALEAPGYGAVVAPVAAAVAFSRVYVGVHYPGDVLALIALGAAAARSLLLVAAASGARAVRAHAGGGAGAAGR